MELDLLSLESVVRFAETWNTRSGPLHALINNAGIFSIGGLYAENFLRKYYFINFALIPVMVPILITDTLVGCLLLHCP